jgi:2,4-dienoyl-CoA reductase-like NADH-dependent reductase (Old Yellow Enzyme family)
LRCRIAKPAMSDSLGTGDGNATPQHTGLYQRWAAGGVALSIIGEVQGDPHALESPGNLVLHESCDRSALAALCDAATGEGAHLWAQLGHAGALAHSAAGRPVGPSALQMEGLSCAEKTTAEIEALPNRFAATAMRAKRSGFSGVQVHAAHGFLLSQFLSPLFNRRNDAWGIGADGGARLLRTVVQAIRDAVGPGFPIGVKINASDRMAGGFDETQSLAAIRALDGCGVDLLEISEGTYFPGAPSSSDGSGGGVHGFSRRVRQAVRVPVMAAGGFKTRAQAAAALRDGVVDVVGVARGLVLDPQLPARWMSGTGPDPVFPQFDGPLPPGAITAWYTMRIAALAAAREADYDLSPGTALSQMADRDRAQAARWIDTFGSAG